MPAGDLFGGLQYMEAKTTYQLTVHGEVLRVGYRSHVERIARKMGVTGYIKNQPDGTAKIVAQAPENQIPGFIQAIKIEEPPIRVEEIKTKLMPTRKAYRLFKIAPGTLIEELQEGLGAGEEQLRLMRDEIRHGFTTMDKKYGEISETLKDLRSDFNRLVTAIEDFLKERSKAL